MVADRTRYSVAILGAGRMGTAIASVFATAGFPTRLHDPSQSALESAEVELQRIAVLLSAAPAPVTPCVGLTDAVAGARLVIEAIPEKLQLKRDVLASVAAEVAPDAIVATNTSAIPIAQLASAVAHPGRFVGAHFWNPPYAVRLVEVVQGPETGPTTVEAIMNLLRAAEMAPVHIKRDVPGFVGNRLQHALKREAIALVAAGVCDAETVDTVTKLGFGRRMAVLGPLEQSDLVGLDLTLSIHEQLMPSLDVTPAPNPYLVEKVRRGELGMRTGSGFREWTPDQAQAVRDRLDRHLLGSTDAAD